MLQNCFQTSKISQGPLGQTFVESDKPRQLQLLPTIKYPSNETKEDGAEDEYLLNNLEVIVGEYILLTGVSNFRNALERMTQDYKQLDEYGLSPRESLIDAVNAVTNLLGMQPCEVTSLFG